MLKGLKGNFVRCEASFETDGFKKYTSEACQRELLVEFPSLALLLDVEEIYNLTSLIDNILTKDVDELWLVAPNALRLTKILAVLMPTSASTERSFSTMGMVKTKLRNTSGDERTDYLVIIKASQDKLKQIDLIKLCNKFTEATAHTGRRKKLFGTFVRSD